MNALPSRLVVSGIVRAADAAGGSAAVLARGDADSGGILLVGYDRGAGPWLFERGFTAAGHRAVGRVGPENGDERAVADYWARRRRSDPDLWVVEVNVARVERFAAETIPSD